MIAERDELLNRAVRQFQAEAATAIHLFGSLARRDGDHLSDIDLWITVPDDKIHTLVARRFEIFGSIADILIYHEAPRNRPLGGSYTLVIHCIGDVLIQCDYYLAPESTSVILPEARRLSGSQALPRGEWLLDSTAEVVEDLHERIDFLICMSFIGIKKARRGDRDFHAFLDREFEEFWGTQGISSPATIACRGVERARALSRSLVPYSNARQRRAIGAIDDILGQV